MKKEPKKKAEIPEVEKVKKPKRAKTLEEKAVMQKFAKALGERIAELRVEKSLLQSDLAHEINIDQQNINRIEKGRTNISVFMLSQIAKAFGITVSELLADI